ncbi:MAG: hypothetical protein P4L98_11160 [Ancalomicrobiaceae bacterium]|nr:hypothetical protein [Ancalomicrobiaceae bacterium]
MIETALYYALGFLTAGLIALILAPALWTRAVRLTRRRIEASQPLTLAEIKADRDQIRAEFAVTSRRLELAIADLRHKNANHRIDLERARDKIVAAEAELEKQRAELAGKDEEIAARDGSIAEAGDRLERQSVELAQKIDVIAALELRTRELTAELDNRRLELAGLQTRLESSGSRSDSELEARRRAEVRIATLEAEIERRGGVIAEERDRADRIFAELLAVKKLGRPESGPRDGDNESKAIEQFEADNIALQMKLREVVEERDRMAHELATIRTHDVGQPADAGDIADLRERLGDVAARMAAMVAEREGSGSEIDRLIGAPPHPPAPPALGETVTGPIVRPPPPAGRKPESLADRIKAMRRSAGSSDPT